MRVTEGIATPLGAQLIPSTSTSGTITVNLAVHANLPALTVVLFPLAQDGAVTRNPIATVPFTARTGSVWHIRLHDVHRDSAYALYTPTAPGRLLSDPYARWVESPCRRMWMQLEGEHYEGGKDKLDNVQRFLSSFVGLNELNVKYLFRPCRFVAPLEASLFDWEGDKFPQLSYSELVIYEAHVKALTSAGTLKAAIEVIPYLKWLGVTALQLMPIFEFVETESGALDGDYRVVVDDEGRKEPESRSGNMWGYSPMSWFSPMNRYAGEGVCTAAVELKMLVRALHNEGIECFLDVVYNHSANACCSLHFLRVQEDYYVGKGSGGRFEHSNLSGCGNTLAPNKPLMLELIVDSLRWFVSEYRIDGFRLDAAGIFCRDENGKPISNPSVIQHICSDPVLRNTKFIVEGWDAGDQIGSPNMLLGEGKGFPRGDRICEWNVEFRDAARRYFKGDKDAARPFCKALRGSPHLFGDDKVVTAARPFGAGHGINFVACHDGFCLADLVSYRKRVNRDGYDEVSFNCGAEGNTSDAQIQATRIRQIRNLIFAVAISRGVPMILQGDELGFSKQGNSNPYNNPQLYAARLSERPQESSNLEYLVRFTRQMLRLRKETSQLTGNDFFQNLQWLDEHGRPRSRRRRESRDLARTGLIAFLVSSNTEPQCIYIALNNSKKDVKVNLPPGGRRGYLWHKVVDTGWTEWEHDVVPRDITGDQKIVVSHQSCLLCTGIVKER